MTWTPIHPGEILADELAGQGLSAAALACLVDVPANRVNRIVAGRRNISADATLRLARYFGTSLEFWMNLQKTYQLDLARRDLGPALDRLPRRPGPDATSEASRR